MIEMNGQDRATCQNPRRDMIGINKIVNDNGTKDEQCSSPSKDQKRVVEGKEAEFKNG